MIEAFKSCICGELDVRSEDKLLLAISGGPDSMALWRLCREAGFQLVVAHMNFNLRGEDSAADEKFVRDFVAGNEKLFVKQVDTKKSAEQLGVSIQMAARKLRYDWFRELSEKQGCAYVLTAHHYDDHIETFLIQLMRNAAPWARQGIPRKNGTVLRPLLGFRKKALLKYLESKAISFRVDKSNQDVKYLRNRVRNVMIPALKNLEWADDGGLNQFVEDGVLLSSIIEDQMIANDKRLGVEYKYPMSIEKRALMNVEYMGLYLQWLLQRHGFNREISDQLLEALNSGPGKTFVSWKYRIIMDRSKVTFDLHSADNELDIETNKAELEMNRVAVVKSACFEKKVDFEPKTPDSRIHMDFDKLNDRVVFRKWRSGDWFIPLGMKGKKKLSDFFIDEKYDGLEKEKQWIMESGNQIVCILGRRLDDRFKITEETKRILSLETVV